MRGFVSLHQHTCWSALDGLTNIPDLVARAKEYGMPGVAITDHGTMSGVFKFYEECKKQGINPIIGEEFYVANRKMTDKEAEFDRKRFHLTVIAKNKVGLLNLFKLSSLAYTEGFYYKPRIDEQTLFKYHEGLIVLSGCHSSKISQYLIGDPEKGVKQDKNRAIQITKAFKQVFGEDFYLEIQTHGLKGCPRPWAEQTKLNDELIKLGKQLGIKVVLTADSHYLDLEDTETHEVLLCIGAQNKYSDPDRWSLRDWDLSFPKPENMEKWLMDEYGTTEYADNTLEINDKVNIEWNYGEYLIPKFDTGKLSEYEYLRQLVYQGFLKKCPEKLKDKVYTERATFELNTLRDMGYLGYFLIVQDYVNWAKDQGIGVGPSRGSACGSLVAYLLNITAIDPMDKGMLFERFINPDRPTMPDIDIDFEDTRREEVVEYVTNKYGKDCVCNILVLGYLKSRSVFKDVARVLSLPFDESNAVTALMPPDVNAKHFPLTKVLEEIEEVKSLYNKNPKVKEVFDYSLKLEGKPRHHGVHACGIIIAPEPLTNYIPVEIDSSGKVVSQFPPEDLEKLGLLKMDFLGLSTISIIQNTLKYIPEINSFYDIPTDDKATYDTFCRGESYFCFQFNTRLGRDTCTKMLPRTIMELSDVTAIARPGPMINIPHYQRRKMGEEAVEYNNKYEEQFFGSTYGINVYQEQGMQYLQAAAGFTRGQADFWRKGVAKAKYDILDDLYPKYLKGCTEHGIPKEDAEKWWHDQREGGSYTFNLAHSYAYAYIGYITCYLLTHYPVQYMSAVMNNVQKDKDKLGECLAVMKKLDIKLKTPNVLKSTMAFTPDGQDIVYGLGAIKGLGTSAEAIIEKVKEVKPKNLEEFLLTFEKRILNKTRLYGLATSGALDCFIPGSTHPLSKRSVIIDNLEEISKWRDKRLKPPTKKGKLFEDPLELPQPPEKLRYCRIFDIAIKEKEAVGNFVTVNPLSFYTKGKHQRTEPEEFTQEEIDKFHVATGRWHRTEIVMPEVYGMVVDIKRKAHNYALISVDLEDRIIDFPTWDNDRRGNFIVNHVYRLTLALDHKSPTYHNCLCSEDVTPMAK